MQIFNPALIYLYNKWYSPCGIQQSKLGHDYTTIILVMLNSSKMPRMITDTTNTLLALWRYTDLKLNSHLI